MLQMIYDPVGQHPRERTWECSRSRLASCRKSLPEFVGRALLTSPLFFCFLIVSLTQEPMASTTLLSEQEWSSDCKCVSAEVRGT